MGKSTSGFKIGSHFCQAMELEIEISLEEIEILGRTNFLDRMFKRPLDFGESRQIALQRRALVQQVDVLCSSLAIERCFEDVSCDLSECLIDPFQLSVEISHNAHRRIALSNVKKFEVV